MADQAQLPAPIADIPKSVPITLSTQKATGFRLTRVDTSGYTCIRPYWINHLKPRELTNEQIVSELAGTEFEQFTPRILDVIHQMETQKPEVTHG